MSRLVEVVNPRMYEVKTKKEDEDRHLAIQSSRRLISVHLSAIWNSGTCMMECDDVKIQARRILWE